jgi:hypothetical protein
MTPLDFTGIWITVLGVGIFMYVVLDGFDLGVDPVAPRAKRPRPPPDGRLGRACHEAGAAHLQHGLRWRVFAELTGIIPTSRSPSRSSSRRSKVAPWR